MWWRDSTKEKKASYSKVSWCDTQVVVFIYKQKNIIYHNWVEKLGGKITLILIVAWEDITIVYFKKIEFYIGRIQRIPYASHKIIHFFVYINSMCNKSTIIFSPVIMQVKPLTLQLNRDYWFAWHIATCPRRSLLRARGRRGSSIAERQNMQNRRQPRQWSTRKGRSWIRSRSEHSAQQLISHNLLIRVLPAWKIMLQAGIRVESICRVEGIDSISPQPTTCCLTSRPTRLFIFRCRIEIT